MRPRNASKPIVWAVWLGCNTPHRLALQWDIPKAKAAEILVAARRAGLLRRVCCGTYAARVSQCVPDGITGRKHYDNRYNRRRKSRAACLRIITESRGGESMKRIVKKPAKGVKKPAPVKGGKGC